MARKHRADPLADQAIEAAQHGACSEASILLMHARNAGGGPLTRTAERAFGQACPVGPARSFAGPQMDRRVAIDYETMLMREGAREEREEARDAAAQHAADNSDDDLRYWDSVDPAYADEIRRRRARYTVTQEPRNVRRRLRYHNRKEAGFRNPALPHSKSMVEMLIESLRADRRSARRRWILGAIMFVNVYRSVWAEGADEYRVLLYPLASLAVNERASDQTLESRYARQEVGPPPDGMYDAIRNAEHNADLLRIAWRHDDKVKGYFIVGKPFTQGHYPLDHPLAPEEHDFTIHRVDYEVRTEEHMGRFLDETT